MDKRTKNILIKVLEGNSEELNYSFLASTFFVSTRSIKNDLVTINEFLTENGFPEMVVNKNGEIRYYCSTEEKDQILERIENIDLYSYKLESEERIRLMLFLIAEAKGHMTIPQLMELTMASRSTVINELKQVKALAEEFNLEINSYTKKGTFLSGKESDIRKMLYTIAEFSSNDRNPMVDDVKALLNGAENKFEIVFSEPSYESVFRHLFVAVNRMRIGCYVEEEFVGDNVDIDCEYQPMAEYVCRLVETFFEVSPTTKEVEYLTNAMAGKEIIQKSRVQDNRTDFLQMVTEKLLWDISDELQIRLFDNQLLRKRLVSCLAEIARARGEVEILRSEKSRDKIDRHQHIYDATIAKIHVAEKFLKCKFGEGAIERIALCIVEAIELGKATDDFSICKAVLISNVSVESTVLLKTQLEREFHIKVQEIFPAHMLETSLGNHKVDLIISTVPVGMEQGKCIYVKFPLSEKNRDSIRNFLMNYEYEKTKSMMKKRAIAQTIGMDISEIFDSVNMPAAGKVQVQEKIKKAIEVRLGIRNGKKDKYEYLPSILEVLKESHIAIDEECVDWKEAIRTAGRILLEDGYITENYMDSMIENVVENGPYIVIGKGAAVPHASYQTGALKLGLSIVKLKNPVLFDNEGEYSVDLIFCISICDEYSHLKLAAELFDIIQDNSVLDRLRQCHSVSEIIGIIRKTIKECNKNAR